MIKREEIYIKNVLNVLETQIKKIDFVKYNISETIAYLMITKLYSFTDSVKKQIRFCELYRINKYINNKKNK